MQEHQTIFSVKEVRNKIKNFAGNQIDDKENKIKIIENWQDNITSGKVVSAKEEELKPFFLTQFFGDVLGYEYNNAKNWNLRFENKTELDSKKADGALGFFKIKEGKEEKKDVRVVIEIKDAKTALDKPQNRAGFKGSAVEQAFMYAAKSGEKCKWIIVSNFLEIRLYQANDMNRYERFDVLALNDEHEFLRFYYLLSKGQLFLEKTASHIDILLQNRQEKEKTITKEFYENYQYLREVFLQHLKLHNPQINPYDLLQYAQTIIDRIIFVSVIKDYDLIQYDVLPRIEEISEKSWNRHNNELWYQLVLFFDALDKGFPKRIHQLNGGLFRKNPKIDNLVIKDVFLKKLLRLNDYDFESDLSVNILGHIFEQSITDIERIKQELIENKNFEYSETDDEITYKSPILETNKRKKEGIFYTPEQITRYIVSNAIGSWLEKKKEEIGIHSLSEFPETDKEKEIHIKLWKTYRTVLSKVKILDPACGSGAFLTQAFDFLLKEQTMVLDVLTKLKEKKQEVKINGLFRKALTEKDEKLIQIKKSIVNNNLFGVDLNYESVEITKLGLWLKSASKNDELALLDNNIKCGNSLINDTSVTEKAFDWHTEFNDILKNGGFDIIVGNPPYVRQENLSKTEKQYLAENYKNTGNTSADLYVYFYEKSFEVLKENGFLGFITPNKWFKTKYGTELRAYLKQFKINKIIDFFELRVFEDAATDTQIIILENRKETTPFNYYPVTDLNDFEEFEENASNFIIQPIEVNPNDFNGSEWIFASQENYKILKRMYENSISLQEYTKDGIEYGIKTGLNKAFIIDKETKNKIIAQDRKSNELIKPYAVPVNIQKYFIEDKDEYFFINTGYDIEISPQNYSGIYNHLKQFDKELEKRHDKGKTKYNLRACDYYDKFEQPKIIYIRTAVEHHFYYDTEKFFVNDSCYIISGADKFLSLWLNSPAFEFFKRLNFVAYGNPEKRGRCKLDYNKMTDVPIPIISENKKNEFELMYDKLFDLTQKLHKQKNSFIEVVKSQLNVGKINRKIENWYDLEWSEFNEELKKVKIKLDLQKTKEWNGFFMSELENTKPLVFEMNNLIDKINKEIYQVYEIEPQMN